VRPDVDASVCILIPLIIQGYLNYHIWYAELVLKTMDHGLIDVEDHSLFLLPRFEWRQVYWLFKFVRI
jgi:hypothetical protein